MVQRKNPSKLGVQADHVKSDKPLANLKLSSSQNQVIKSKDTDRKKKMKKPRSIKLSDLETLQSLPSGRILSQQGKPLPFHVPTTAPSPQKQKPLARTIDRSPNYMKPTSSSDAKKELFPASLWNTQSGLDGKKASSVCSEKPATSLTRSSSLVLIRTLTKTPSFKPSRGCPRKSATTVMSADVNAPERATCSSTLKDSKFPSYLILNPGATECEGASVMKVCSYKYCSLNCHHQASFPPLKTFMLERRRQKSMKMEALGSQRLKVSCETKVNDIEQIVFDGKPEYDEAEMANPTIHPLAKENLEDQEVNSIIEENGLAVEEDGVKEVTPSMAHDVPNSEFDLEEDSKNCFDDVTIKSDTKGSFHQEQNAEEPDENHQLGWYHEELYMGSYSSEVSYDGEHMENIELDVSDSQYNDMLWEEEQYCALGHEEDIDSSVFTEETDESILESSHDVAIWMDDIGSSHNADILVEEAVQEANEEESTCSETEPHGTNSATEGISASLETSDADYCSNRITCDQSSLREEVFQNLTNADDNGESEKHVCDDISSATNEEMVEACEIDESREDSDSSLGNSDESISQEKQSIIVVKELQLLEGDQVKANKLESISLIGHEKENTNRITCGQSPNLTNAEDDNGENKKHVYGDISSATNEEMVEACEIDESREDSDSSLENTDESISQEKQSIIVVKELQLLEEDQVKANKLESISLIGHEKENTNGITCDQSSSREDVFQNLTNAEDDNGENKKRVYDDISSATNEEMVEACEIDESHEDSDSSLENNDESISPEKQSIIVVKELQLLEEDQVKANRLESISLIGHEKENTNGITCDQSSSREDVFQNLTNAEDDNGENKKCVYDDISSATNEEMVEACEIDESREDSDSSLENTNESISQEKQSVIVVKELQLLERDQVKANKLESISLIGHEKEKTSKNWQRETRPKRLVQDDDEGMRKINPRKPNFLPLAPDPEPEKVNLKHQMMDERKNADEWMLDFALRQAVTKLAPAGKRKVALLVEAFETVMSIPKCETHVRNNSPFAHARPIQACS